MSLSEVDFLKDQVEKLNAVLLKYQDQLQVNIQELEVYDAEAKPWFTDKSIMSPLMQEYDSVIHQFQKDSDVYKHHVFYLKQQFEEIVSENEDLRRDLKELLCQIQVSSPANDDSCNGHMSANSVLSVTNVQEQLKLALQEKDGYDKKLETADEKMCRLQADLQSLHGMREWMAVVKNNSEEFRTNLQDLASLSSQPVFPHLKHRALQDHHASSATVLKDHLESGRADFSPLQQELIASQHVICDLRTENSLLRQQLSNDDGRVNMIIEDGITDGNILELRHIADDLQKRMLFAHGEVSKIRREKGNVEGKLSEAERRLLAAEDREKEAVEHVQEAIATSERCLYEKNQVELVMQHKEQELVHLQESIAEMIEKAGARTREEVDSVKEQSNERMSKLTEELYHLEIAKVQQQGFSERLMREKRAVESELLKVNEQMKLERRRTKESVGEFSRRLSDVERERNSLHIKVESLQQILAKERDEHEQQKAGYKVKLHYIEERLSTLMLEYSAVSDDRLKNEDLVNNLTKRLQQSEQEKELVQRKFMKKIALVEDEHRTKERAYEVQIQSVEVAHFDSVSQLRKLLVAQQRMTARWKEECQMATRKFEVSLEESRSEAKELRHRNDELVTVLRESQSKTADAERLISQYAHNIRSMEKQVHNAEPHTSTFARATNRVK